MRFVYIIMFILIIAISSSGCSSNTEKNEVNSESTAIKTTAKITANSTATATSKPADTSISEPSALSDNVSNAKEEVIIKTSYEKPLSLNNKDTILLEGVQQGEEYIEVVVTGEMFDFEQIALTWDESKNELKEKKVVKSIKKLENQILVIKTYQAEGIPSEKIKWKSKTGKTYEYLISESSLDDTDNNVTKFDMK